MDNVLPFTRAFKPHPVEQSALPLAEPEKLFSRETLENFTDVVPREHFGLRARGAMDSPLMPEDRVEVDRIKRAARAAREAQNAPPNTPSEEDFVAVCLIVDQVALKLVELGRRTVRPSAFALLAHDANALSEKISHLASEVTP